MEREVPLSGCEGTKWNEDFDLLCITLTKPSIVEVSVDVIASHEKQAIHALVPSLLSKMSHETKKKKNQGSIKKSVLLFYICMFSGLNNWSTSHFYSFRMSKAFLLRKHLMISYTSSTLQNRLCWNPEAPKLRH